MINKTLLTLPGAQSGLSVLTGVLRALGIACDAWLIIILLQGLGSGLQQSLTQGVINGFTPLTFTMIALVILMRIAFSIAAHSITKYVSQHMSSALQTALMDAAFDADNVRLHPRNVYSAHQSLTQLAAEGIPSLVGYFTNYLPTFAQAITMIFIAAAVLSPLHAASGAAIVVGMFAVPFAANASRSKNIDIHRKHLQAYEGVALRFEESLKGLSTLKIYDADGREAERLAEGSEGFRKTTMQLLAGQLTSLIASDAAMYIAIAVSIATAALNTSVLTTIIVAAVSVRCFDPMRQFVYLAHSGAVASRRAKAYQQVINTPHKSDTSDTADGNYAAADPSASLLTIQHLEFTYPGAQTPALQDISVTLPERGLIAVIGPSGSGKTTFASLISSQYTSYTGSITLTGKQLQSLSVEDVAQYITVIHGTDTPIAQSVRDTLDPDHTHTDDVLLAVLKQVELPLNLTYELTPMAANLSGGQRQRLLCARALLLNTPIYLFDEATSALDAEHDTAMWNIYSTLAERALVIVITHRLAHITKASRVLCFHHGRLIEDDTPQKLLAQHTLTHDMAVQQQQFETQQPHKSQQLHTTQKPYKSQQHQHEEV